MKNKLDALLEAVDEFHAARAASEAFDPEGIVLFADYLKLAEPFVSRVGAAEDALRAAAEAVKAEMDEPECDELPWPEPKKGKPFDAVVTGTITRPVFPIEDDSEPCCEQAARAALLPLRECGVTPDDLKAMAKTPSFSVLRIVHHEGGGPSRSVNCREALESISTALRKALDD